MQHRVLAFVPVVLAALIASAPAVAARADACPAALTCTTVTVPIDRSGTVPGTIPLHVEELPAKGTPRGAVFLVAGGPGQGSAEAYDLGSPTQAEWLRFLYPGYTLVSYDDRGTGRSDALDCPALDTASSSDDEAVVAGQCAAQLGPAASFYSTADHAADLDAVRQALGFDRIVVSGVSYGTKLALAYAAAYPQHVERLVLDSIVAPTQPDPFAANVARALPATLAHYCAGGLCSQATPSYPADVVALVNRFGATSATRETALMLLRIIIDSDLDPGLAAELPAAVHAARGGDIRPLVHVMLLDGSSEVSSPEDFSEANYIATSCDDQPFPWDPSTPFAERDASLQAALDAMPAGAFGPFGTWAGELGNADLCTDWPTPVSDVPPVPAALPDVPVLAFSGGLDLRTPTSDAAAVVARFPQGHLVVVPGVGHSVLTADPSTCSALALRNWISGSLTPAATCPRSKPYVAPLAAFPGAHATRHDAASTKTLVTQTLREAEAVWLATSGLSGSKARLPGLRGGHVVETRDGFTLVGYSIAPGVAVNGTVRIAKIGPPIVLSGTVHVVGADAAHGALTFRAGTLTGRLAA